MTLATTTDTTLIHSLDSPCPCFAKPWSCRRLGAVIRTAGRKLVLAFWLGSLLLGPAGAEPLWGQEPDALAIASRFGGFVNTFVLDQNRLLVAQANALQSFEVNGVDLMPSGFLFFASEPNALAVAAGTAYLALEDRLQVIAVDGPLTVLGALTASSPIRHLAAGDGIVVLALDADGLAVVDVSDPTQPSILAALPLTARDVVLDGAIAFVATESGLATVDLADPANPAVLAAVDTGAQQRVLVADGMAFLFGGFGDGLQILDITDPAAPALLLDRVDGDSFFHLDTVAQRLFAITQNGLVVLDLTDPSDPMELGTLALPFTSALQATEAGDRVLMTPFGQLQFVDVSQPATPTLVNSPESPAFATDHVQNNGQLLIAADDGFWRYDLALPDAPQVLEHLPQFPLGTRIQAAGEITYLIDQAGVLHALGPGSEATTTQELGSLVLPPAFSPAVAFEVRGSRGYVLGFGKLLVVDLSDPSAPLAAGQANLPLGGRDLVILAGDQHLALALSDFGPEGQVAIVDVANAAAPLVVGAVTVAGRPDAITAAGTRVHVLARSADQQGFHIHSLDVSVPASPSVTATVGGTGDPKDITMLADGRLAAVFASGGELAGAPVAAKGMGIDGTLRVFDTTAGIAAVSSLSIPSPASLSSLGPDSNGSAPDPALPPGEVSSAISSVVTLSGDKLETSQSVLGSKGLTVSIPRGIAIPELTLSASSQTRLECPPLPGEEVAIASFTVCVDIEDSWMFSTLSMRGFGTGDEAADLEHAILRFAGGEPVGNFSADNGTVSFPIGLVLAAGQCTNLALSYRLTPEASLCSQEETKTFAIDIRAANVGAEPLNAPGGSKLPPQPFFTAPIELACVENETKKIGFPKVQPAIDDARTEEGDAIGVCPGTFVEQVVVDKNDLLVHSKQGAPVTFLGEETEIDCQSIPAASADRVTLSADGVILQGFTITGARNGVVIQGKNAMVKENLIGGNSGDGVRGAGAGRTDATILDNEIGEPLSAVGGVPTKRRNGANGVSLRSGASDKVEINEIFGNCAHGVKIEDQPTSQMNRGEGAGNTLLANLLRGNLANGVSIQESGGNTIGDATGAGGNVMGGNGQNGIEITGDRADGNKILGNRIGVDFGGIPLANRGHGVYVHEGPDFTKIGDEVAGDACTGACNAISVHEGDGIHIGDDGTPTDRSEGTSIRGNFIGVSKAGKRLVEGTNATSVAGNAIGVHCLSTEFTFIDDNLISGNRKEGVRVSGSVQGSSRIEIGFNRIGTDKTGDGILQSEGDDPQPIGNGASGISIFGTLQKVEIFQNLISGNNQDNAMQGAGILIQETKGAMPVFINKIGTNKSGTAALPNRRAGILVLESQLTAIENNLISGNPTGVHYKIPANPASNHLLKKNKIGLTEDQTGRLPNGTGVLAQLGAVKLVIDENIVSGNDDDGIRIEGFPGLAPTTTGVLIRNNLIGATLAPGINFGNRAAGISLVGASGNTIGGIDDASGEMVPNLIAFNEIGISFSEGSSNNTVTGNPISSSMLHGIRVVDSSNNTLGTTAQGFGNLILEGSVLGGSGISVISSNQVSIRGNTIATAQLPIDLDDDGPTPNDEVPLPFADDDVGANDLQNYPIIIDSEQVGGMLNVSGRLITKPGTYLVDLYSGRCHEGVNGPGRLTTLLATLPVVVPPVTRTATFDVAIALDFGVFEVVATATGVDGTSEIPSCGLGNSIFRDDFENGNTSTWSDVTLRPDP